MARRYTVQCSLPNTHTVCIELDGGRQAGRQGRSEEGWRMGEREQGWVGEGGSKGGSEGAVMCGGLVREWRKVGRVEEGNE